MRKILAALLGLTALSAVSSAQIGPGFNSILASIKPCPNTYDNWSNTSSTTVPGRASAVTVSGNVQTTPQNLTGTFSTVKPVTARQVFEVTITTVQNGAGVGLCKSGESTGNGLGFQPNCYGYLSTSGILHNGGAVTCASVACPNFTTGDKIGVIFGFGAFWLTKNSTPLNGASFAEMAAGITSHAIVTGLTGSWVAAGGDSSVGTSVQTNSFRSISFNLPTGFCPWNTGP